jgi:lipopolysaccharide/colanic/teichoic acid biosynthesis glycosyltransferase
VNARSLTLTLTAPTRPAGRSGRKGLLVIGDEDVCTAVAVTAPLRGRVMAGRLHPTGPQRLVPDGWDELVIDARLLRTVAEERPELLRRASRVWLVASESTTLPPFTPPLPRLGRVLKRVLDVVLSVIGLLLMLPLLAVVLVAVRCESAGPVIFKQVRMGANGRRFRMYKVRTMYQGNDDSDHRRYVADLIAGLAEPRAGVFKLTDDPRVTRVGRLLRHLSIDELPQLWNVLKGDMSLVGPRPPLPGETELYSAEAWERLAVRPGITGLWQVSGRSQLSFDEMVSLDVNYWKGWTLWSDLAILLRTPKAVLSGRGAA